MKNIEKYRTSYCMPPELTYDWAKKSHIDHPPVWCSIDLCDGSRSPIEPMNPDEKLEYFQMLIDIGFKQISVSSPAANDSEFEFMRTLIEHNLIPDDVTVQVLTQADRPMIQRTFEALKGVKHAIIHLHNPTSVSYLEQIDGSKQEIKQMAVDCAAYVKELSETNDGDFYFQYSPEFFSGTETDYALEICNAIIDVWQPTPDHKCIINLPTTVENAMSHVFACQIEYMIKHLNNRECLSVSLHPHNDRGCSVTDAELGLLAGADRLEGSLFGCGERTGNLDIVTVALNMYAQGIDPQLDFSHMDHLITTYERLTHMHVHDRSPYAGKLVFTDFSASHHNEIAKGMQRWQDGKSNGIWSVPYLPVDPMDIGRSTHSGKGDVCYILKQYYGFVIPFDMKNDIGNYIKSMSDKHQREFSPEWIFSTFSDHYMNQMPVFSIPDYQFKTNDGIVAEITVRLGDKSCVVSANGNGRFDAVSNAVKQYFGINYEVILYEVHALSHTSSSKAATYIGIRSGDEICWGIGADEDSIRSSVCALVVAVNRLTSIKQMSGKDDRIVAILNYIQNNYSTVTLDTLSKEFFLSKPYLSKYIKEHSGTTFGETVKTIRMDKAKSLLKNKGMTVESIARNVGYENVEHFNRLFKKLFRMTPVQFRNSK